MAYPRGTGEVPSTKVPPSSPFSPLAFLPPPSPFQPLPLSRADTPPQGHLLEGTPTKYMSGCQAIRQKIGHILFGFRVVYGEVIFVTISPNRRHSSLLLRLSRVRANDTTLQRQDLVYIIYHTPKAAMRYPGLPRATWGISNIGSATLSLIIMIKNQKS